MPSPTACGLSALLFLLALGQGPQTRPADAFPRSTVPLAEGLSFADHLTVRAPTDFLRAHPTLAAGGLVHAVVEIPAGTCEKWEVKRDGVLRWDMKDDQPRHVRYLGYPCNYGMVPRTLLGQELAGDGDPLDILVLGPALPRGTVLPVHVVGLIRLIDAGARDDKILAVPAGSPLLRAATLAELDTCFPGITAILRTWFENYKGPAALQCTGFAGKEDALALVTACGQSFLAAERSAAGPATRPDVERK